MTKTNITGKANPPLAIIGFEDQRGDFVAVLADQANVYSEAAFDDTIDEEAGFGEGGFGEEGFGS